MFSQLAMANLFALVFLSSHLRWKCGKKTFLLERGFVHFHVRWERIESRVFLFVKFEPCFLGFSA